MSYKNKNYVVEFRQKNKRTIPGWLTKVYGRMRQSSRERKQPMPKFDKAELLVWAVKNNLNDLFHEWLKSGCKKALAPSINRLDDFGGYSFGNMELTTWDDNNKKGRGSVKVRELVHSKLGGIAKKMFSKPVIKSSLDGVVLAVYPSAREAARQNKTDSGSIAKVCRGEKKSHHSLKWDYAK